MTMGNRGSADGTEYDAFCRRSRRMICWRRGELHRVKRRYNKRQRKAARLAIAACHANSRDLWQAAQRLKNDLRQIESAA